MTVRAADHGVETGAPALLRLLDAFEFVVAGRPQHLPAHAQRVLAFLAVRGRTQPRATLAGSLWSNTDEDRSHANLRTALWRIRQVGPQAIRATHSCVTLEGRVEVDLDALVGESRRMRSDQAHLPPRDDVLRGLRGDLLPDWDEDWLTLEREHLRQVRLHALEALSRRLSQAGRHADAIEAACAAIAVEPLRQSAHTVLIEAHLAEGNVSEARRQYRRCADVMRDELKVEPCENLRRLVGA